METDTSVGTAQSSSQPAQQAQSPFDRLPDELLSKIFEIGCQLDFSNTTVESSHQILEMYGPWLHRRPYDSIKYLKDVCMRFQKIIDAPSNGHFYHVIADPTGGQYDDIPPDKVDIMFWITKFHETLKLSEGCDIHLVLRPSIHRANTAADVETSMRFILHSIKSIEREGCMRQIASVSLYGGNFPRQILPWVIKWLGSRSAFPRLQSIYVAGSMETPLGGVVFDTSLFDDALMLSPQVTKLPSLARLELSSLSPECTPSPLSAHSLTRITLGHLGDEYTDWPKLKATLASCFGLRSLDMLVRRMRGEFASYEDPHIPCNIGDLILTCDATSFNTIFRTFKFPFLTQANILVLYEAEPEIRFWSDATSRFPSLKSLSYIDGCQNGLERLRCLHSDTIDHLAIKLVTPADPNELEASRESIRGPKRLDAILGDGTTVFEQLAAFDLKGTEWLELAMNGTSLYSYTLAETSTRITASPKVVSVVGPVDILSVLPWLAANLNLPSRFRLAINVRDSFEIMRNDGPDAESLPLKVTSLNIPAAGYSGVHYGCNYGTLPKGALCSLLGGDGKVWYDGCGSSVIQSSYFKDAIMRDVETIQIVVKSSYNTEDIYSLDGSEEDGSDTPFPGLKTVNVKCSWPYDEDIKTQREALEAIMKSRKKKGFPVEDARIVYPAGGALIEMTVNVD